MDTLLDVKPVASSTTESSAQTDVNTAATDTQEPDVLADGTSRKKPVPYERVEELSEKVRLKDEEARQAKEEARRLKEELERRQPQQPAQREYSIQEMESAAENWFSQADQAFASGNTAQYQQFMKNGRALERIISERKIDEKARALQETVSYSTEERLVKERVSKSDPELYSEAEKIYAEKQYITFEDAVLMAKGRAADSKRPSFQPRGTLDAGGAVPSPRQPSITLSPEEREMAYKSGIGEQEFIKEKLAIMKRDGRI